MIPTNRESQIMSTSGIQSVPLLDVNRQNAPLMSELQSVFQDVLSSGRFIMGPEVEAFESECRQVLNVEHAIAVSSGTDALLVALMGLDIGPGDEVICPTYSFFATAGSISRTGARPVMVDVESDTLNISPAAIEQAVTDRTKAIMPVHLFGQCADMASIMDIARRNDLLVIEDAAQAFGSSSEPGPVGTVGSLGCFSFFPSKNLGGFGDGGLVTTEDRQLADRIRSLRSHGSKPKYFHREVGGNFRMDALQCALMRVKLPYLETYVAGRRRNALMYDDLFKERSLTTDTIVAPAPLLVPAVTPYHNFNQYILTTRNREQRDGLRQHLKSCGIGSEVYYPLPLHLQDCYAHLDGCVGDCPVAENAANTTVAIPIFAELTDDEIHYVADRVEEYFSSSRM